MAESFLTQAEKISALEDSLAESQAVVVALLRAFGRDISVPHEYLGEVGYEIVCTDSLDTDTATFGIRRADPGIWDAVENPGRMCPSVHPKALRDVRSPGGWRDRGPGYDHEHWAPTELEEADLRPEQSAGPRVDPRTLCAGCAGGHTYGDDCAWLPPVQQSEILPLSDQVQPLEPLPPRIRSLALPDGRFAFVVSGWTPPEDPDKAQEFRVRMAGFGRMCGAIATTVFEEHIEVS